MYVVASVVITCVVGVSGLAADLSFMAADNANQCGVEASSNLIHHNPWLADLELWKGNKLSLIRCAATLIDSRHLLTAAHCVKKHRFTQIVVRLGEYDIQTQQDCVDDVCADGVVRIGVEEVFVNPRYDGNSHDIAVLRLEHDAPYTDFIRPICLPSGTLEEKTTFVAAGWGELPTHRGSYSHAKKIVPLPYWSPEKCQAVNKYETVPENVICAGGESGIDTCNGDSGGPLTRVGKTIELWGVTSRGNRLCGTKNSPAFYTNVLDHMPWIQEVLSDVH